MGFSKSLMPKTHQDFLAFVIWKKPYLPEVDIQVQNGQEVLGSLVPSILDMGLAKEGSRMEGTLEFDSLDLGANF